MEKIIFATNNQHKVDEIRHHLAKRFKIITLKEAGIDVEIPEPHDRWRAMHGKNPRLFMQLPG